MSLSEEVRRSDALALLGQLFVTLGDGPIDCTFFDCSDAVYAEVKITSWDELCSEGLLIKKTDSFYALTANGWSEGLIRTDVVSTSAFSQRIGQLAKSLKDQIKGRQKSAIMPFDDVVRFASLPAGWVFNAIDSHLISRVHGKRDASWFEGARGRVVEIPRDFGLIEVDLFADVRAENLKLMETVERMEELYTDYRCDICSAPLTTRGSWEHEYGSEEIMEYACGMTIGAPYGDTPCTQSPNFPKFEDLVLTTKYDGNMWWCFAHAKSCSIYLSNTSAKTEEEAKAEMHNRYLERAKHWKR
ncbi:MAG: hypothetical protein LAO78_21610 [Acidobacteriia bacterium]|nr:hypothetical protein [Terriglobia bacterium]